MAKNPQKRLKKILHLVQAIRMDGDLNKIHGVTLDAQCNLLPCAHKEKCVTSQ